MSLPLPSFLFLHQLSTVVSAVLDHCGTLSFRKSGKLVLCLG
jgi:hypothetical protein